MKSIVLLISLIFMGLLLAQKQVNDPFKKWKEYKRMVDINVNSKKYTYKINTKKMCPYYHGIKMFSKKDSLVFVKGFSGGICGVGGYDFYFKNGKLFILRKYEEFTTKEVGCEGLESTYVEYYIEGERIVNFSRLKKTEMTEKELYDFIKEREKLLFEAIKSGCF